MPRPRYSIDDLKLHALGKDGECLSTDYAGNKSKYEWRCAKGHIWSANWSNIKNHGQWCPLCARNYYTIEDLRAMAKSRKGKCNSEKYSHGGALYQWQCEHGHEWDATWESIKGSSERQGSWCPNCRRNSYTMEDLVTYAAERGGKCLSDIYVNTATRYEWQCRRGHVWKATWAQLVAVNTWCRECVRPTYTIDDLQKHAISRGGRCQSERYEGSHSRYRWVCREGHEWDATWSSVNHSTWCPECANCGGHNRKWDRESLEDEVKKYESVSDFISGSNGAYKAALRLDIIPELFRNHENEGRKKMPSGYWNRDHVKMAALEHSSRSDFQKENLAAYSAAHKNGWLDDVCLHMKPIGNIYRRLIYAILVEEQKKVYVGLTYDLDKRLIDHRRKGTAAVRALLEAEHKVIELTDLLEYEDAARQEGQFVQRYQTDGYEVVNKIATGGLGGAPIKWTAETVAKEAKDCSTRTEFQKMHPGAYQYALRHGIVDEVFANHANKGFSETRGPEVKWTRANVQKLALGCIKRVELKRKSPAAYAAARKKGWLDEFFPKQ